MAFYMVVLGKRKVHRNRQRAGTDLQLDLVVLQQQAELFQVVVVVQIRPGQRGLEAAWAGNKAVAQVRAFQHRGAGHGFGVQAYKGVAGTHVAGQGFAGDEALHGGTQMVDLLVVNQPDLRQGSNRVGEAGGGDKGGQIGHRSIVQRNNVKQEVAPARAW